MPSIIKDQTWSGGSGAGDPQILIGYCKEEPKEVLEAVYETHYIYDYRGLYRPIDYRFPNNVSGLVLDYVSWDDLRKIGITALVSVSEFDLNVAKSKDIKRNKKIFMEAYEAAKSWHIRDENDVHPDRVSWVRDRNYKMNQLLNEVISITLQ